MNTAKENYFILNYYHNSRFFQDNFVISGRSAMAGMCFPAKVHASRKPDFVNYDTGFIVSWNRWIRAMREVMV